MSRVKRSSGKEYRKLTQTADSDEDVVQLPPSSTQPPPSSLSSTTEFGNGRYDKGCDLELPAPPRGGRPRRERRLKPAVRLKKGFGWRASRETKACLCFLGLLAAAMIVVALAVFQLSDAAESATSPPLQSSVFTATSTPAIASPSPLTHPTTTAHTASEEPPATTKEPSTTTEEPPATTNEPITTTEEPQTVTNEPITTTEEPQTVTNEPITTTEEPQTVTNEPSTTTEEPQTATNEPSTTTEEPQTVTNEPSTTTEEPQSTKKAPSTTTEEPQTTTNEPSTTTEEPQSTKKVPSTASEEPPTSEERTSSSPSTQPIEEGGSEAGDNKTLTPSPDTPLTPSLNTPLTPSQDSPSPPPPNEENRSISWHRNFFPAITETALQLKDVSGDGVSDVVMVEGRGQCEMVVRVLDGLTGTSVWEANVTYDAFAVRCEVDLDADGLVDCIAAGRQSGFRALRGSDGSVLWDRDPRLAFLRYNFYFPLFVPDLDGDGVQDIVITHGGDSTYRGSDTKRSTGFLEAVSGRTGQQLMERVPLPDGQETYNSPVYLSRGGPGDVVLVGTGGESLPGSLWAFGYTSLRERISEYLSTQGNGNYTPFTGYINHPCERDMSEEEMEEQRPMFDAGSFDAGRNASTDSVFSGCTSWGPHEPVWNRFGLCVYRLVSGEKKGVLLPPVVVDMTGDEQDDLVVSLFEGKTLVINGETGEVVWEVFTPGTESYSIPAPLYFHSDTVPDLLVRLNYGEWDTYNQSTLAVLDGRNGHTLWSFGSVKTGMMSGLSLAATQPGADAAVFITMGTIQNNNNNNNNSTVQVRSVLEKEVRERRHDGPHDAAQVSGEPENEEEEDDDFVEMDDNAEPQIDEFMAKAVAYRDPPGLWDGAGTEFPDPILDLSAFLLDYCGWREEELTASLYILSPQEALSGLSPPPLFSSGPFVYFPGYREKRHDGPHPGHTPSSSNSSDGDQRGLRCSHIMIPEMIVSTPAIGDIDEDGRLEIAYLVSWRANSRSSEEVVIQELPPRFTVFVKTLEMRVKGEEEGETWLESFLPGGQQPWTHYMGARGDNIYSRPTP